MNTGGVKTCSNAHGYTQIPSLGGKHADMRVPIWTSLKVKLVEV